MVSVIGIMLGIFTRVNTIVNYLCTLFITASLTTFSNHIFMTFLEINFLLMFIPVSRVWSLDRLFLKLRYSDTKFTYDPPKTVSSMAYLLPVFFAIGLVYFESTFYKLADPYWLDGLGSWGPASLSIATISRPSWIVNSEFLEKALGYLTLSFEALFLFLMWSKRLRWMCFIIGFGLHVGILLEFPIPFFAYVMMSIYLLVLPVGIYKWLDNIKLKKPLLFFYYDSENLICVRTKIALEHLDILSSVAFLSIQDHDKNKNKLKDSKSKTVHDDIYTVSEKGKVARGIDAYIRVFNAIFYLKPLSWILRLPIIYTILSYVYDRVTGRRSAEKNIEDTSGYVTPVPRKVNDIKLSRNLTIGKLKLKLVVLFLYVTIILQAIISFNSDLVTKLRLSAQMIGTNLDEQLFYVSNDVCLYGTLFMGLTRNHLFTSNYLTGYQQIVRISYCFPDGHETDLPLIDTDGMPGAYNRNFNWGKWSFIVCNPNVNVGVRDKGIRSYTAFWANKNDIALDNDKFKIYTKKLVLPTHWEKDFLKNQINNHNWVEAGSVTWKNKQCTITRLSNF